MLHFGTDGVRGVALDELTVELSRDLGRAVARVLKPAAVVIGRDTRESGSVLEAAVVEGCAVEGVPVHLMGVAPTPAVAFAAEKHEWVGIAITASHNPWQDNGIKVFAAGGHKLTDAQQIDIEREWHALNMEVSPTARGVVHDALDLVEEYVESRVGVIGTSHTLDGLRVVVDCANGAMSTAGPAVLQSIGLDLVVINDMPDGRNINASCGATSPAALAAAVVREGAAFGVAFDGDGDRLVAVDATGAIVDGDHIMAIAAIDLASRGLLRNKGVAVTVMSNLGFHEAMSAHDIAVVVTPVGDRSVLAALEEHDYVLGGEQSGHIVHRAHATTGDGLLAAVLLAEFLHRTRTSLADAATVMTTYPQVLINVRTNERISDPATEFNEVIASVESEMAGKGRVLVRASGTEPLVRVMVEAPTANSATQGARTIAEAILSIYTGEIEGTH
jgi:phosphoglucosamine mutase